MPRVKLVRVDVLVVGAGPAGAAAALAARQADPTATIVLADRATFPRDKACGDGIGPDAWDVLERLGVSDVLRDEERFAAYRLRGPGGHEVVGTSPRAGWVIPRAILDARLVEAATRAGVDLVHHRVRSLTLAPDAVVVDDRFAARAVIGADGANSVVRRQVGVARPRSRHLAVAIRGYAERPHGRDAIELAWEGRHGLAYTWAFPTADGRMNVGYGLLASRHGGGRRRLEAALSERLPELPPVPGTVLGHTLPLASARPELTPHPRVLLSGDAANMVNPLSGEGIYYALVAGALAGEAAVRRGAPADGYRAALAAAFGHHWRHIRRLTAALYLPGPVTAMLVAARHEPATFAMILDLALGHGTVTSRGVATTTRGLFRSLSATPPRT